MHTLPVWCCYWFVTIGSQPPLEWFLYCCVCCCRSPRAEENGSSRQCGSSRDGGIHHWGAGGFEDTLGWLFSSESVLPVTPLLSLGAESSISGVIYGRDLVPHQGSLVNTSPSILRWGRVRALTRLGLTQRAWYLVQCHVQGERNLPLINVTGQCSHAFCLQFNHHVSSLHYSLFEKTEHAQHKSTSVWVMLRINVSNKS